MHRSLSMNFQYRFFSQQMQTQVNQVMAKRVVIMEPCEVFISHRSMDTKRTVATLMYDDLRRLGFHPFLDNKTMKPGDKLFDKINKAIMECRIGLAVISPRYCESYFCLHELSLLMECKKKVIPIFCDIKPSQLRVINNRKWTPEDLHRFKLALEEAKYTVGLNFNTSEGNFSDIVTSASDIIIKSLIELKDEEQMQHPDMDVALSIDHSWSIDADLMVMSYGYLFLNDLTKHAWFMSKFLRQIIVKSKSLDSTFFLTKGIGIVGLLDRELLRVHAKISCPYLVVIVKAFYQNYHYSNGDLTSKACGIDILESAEIWKQLLGFDFDADEVAATYDEERHATIECYRGADIVPDLKRYGVRLAEYT
ncbi:disease resistance protein LAZ5-like [Gastrolobium bilobum]|uniref:disease resistance protein LAZ5-like n=1 Tax=Gastrolobium bilobum TaxID=150636 RepID=UPI002AB04AA5|nr:disease resistance protein LAZ5-like [Gastrolobium bilobum]